MASLSLSTQSKQRQIVILGAAGVVLAGLLMFQLPKTLKLVKGEEAPTTAPSTQAPTPVAPQPSPTPVTPTAPASPTTSPMRSAALMRFKSKDPFVPQISTDAAPTAGTQSSASNPSPSSTPPSPSSAPPAPPAPANTGASFTAVQPSEGNAAPSESAVIAVNGVDETVKVSESFPKDNPVFKLVSLGDGTAKVGVARGSLKGSETVTLTKGEPLTLLNTVDGKRYRLLLR